MEKLLIAAMLTLSASITLAAQEEAPPPPPIVDNGEGVEPEVTIVEKKDAVHTEYRLKGKLYMIKVTPKNAPPYYLVDQEGNGRFTRLDNGGTNISVPRWVLFEW
ncbi:DUF2782 domain-containing protein [Chitinibacteraceae bacterium HSL-7]